MKQLHKVQPTGWQEVLLGDIAEIVGGKPAPQDPKAFADNGIPFVRMKDLGRYHLTTDLSEVDDKISSEFASSRGLTPLRAGAILMPRSGSVALNHRAILGIDAIIVSHICAIVPSSRVVYNKYLYYYLCTVTLEKMTKKTTGLDAINFSDLRKLLVPLPPIDEQHHIAALLDSADRVRRKRAQALMLVDELLKASFIERFGNPITNRNALPTAPIRELGRVVTGNTPSRANPENYGDAIEWIKSDNINTPEHFLTPAEEHLSQTGRAIGRTVPPGSTLVTCIAGSPSVIGNASLTNREVAFNQQINAVVPHHDTDPLFLYCQFLVGKNLIQASSTNSMKGMVSKGKFQEINFLKPNYDAQKEFGQLFERVLQMRGRVREDGKFSEQLFGSLTTRAFRGEL